MKSTTALIVRSAVPGETSAHTANARTEPAAAKKTRRFNELAGESVGSTVLDACEDSGSLMSIDVTVTGVPQVRVGGRGFRYRTRATRLPGAVVRAA
ncbi:hypothetical protein GCM10027289_07160 [Tsukamurella serpentis]